MKIKAILSLVAFAGLFGCAWSAPFAEWFEGVSPNGIAVRVWGTGDEYSVRYEAEDGHAVVYDEGLGAYVYARQNATGALVSVGIAVGDETAAGRIILEAIPLHLTDASETARLARLARIAADDELTGRAARWEKLKAQNRAQRLAKERGLLTAPPKRPTLGCVTGLTLLVDFPTSGSKTTWSEVHPGVTAADLEQLLNGDGELPYGNSTSVRGYYKDMSNGRLDYRNIVIGPIKVANPRTHYDIASKSCGTCAGELIGDVLTALKNNKEYSSKYLPLLKSLDNEAGTVRLLNIWFAGAKAAVWNKGLWAHKSSLDSTTARILENVGGATIRFGTYQITPITASPYVYTFCHENGHMLCDFPDLYSYDKDANGEAIGGNGVGYFSVMKGSTSNTNPIGLDAYLRTAAGWIEPKVLPHGGGTVAVRANGSDVWRYDNPNDPNQYYLIENRQQKGHDANIRGAGILIWRCDEAGSNTHPTELTGFADNVHRWSYELSLEQADGDYDLETDMIYTNGDGDKWDPWYYGNKNSNGVFNDDSVPCARWRDARASGLSLSAFSENGDTMTFQVAKYGDRPVNDDFAHATVIDSQGGGEVRSSVGATKEAGEPTHGSSSATKSIWWRLDVPKKAMVVLSTEGSAIDTCLAVYTGDSVDTLSLVVRNDNAASGVMYSKVEFAAEGGCAYYVAVAGKAAASGDIALNWSQTPTPGLPDLKPASPTDSYPYAIFIANTQTSPAMTEITSGDPIYYTYRIVNVGSAAVTNKVTMTHILYDENNTCRHSSKTTYSTFKIGTTLTWSKSEMFNGLALDPGEYRIVCTIDSANVIDEENERNNVAEFKFTIKPNPALPDLAFPPPSEANPYPIYVSNVSNGPPVSVFDASKHIYFNFRVLNDGGSAVTESVTISTSLYDDVDNLVETKSTTYANFPVGKTWKWSNLDWFDGLDLPAGEYRLVCEIDSKHAIVEGLEKNNVAEYSFTIRPCDVNRHLGTQDISWENLSEVPWKPTEEVGVSQMRVGGQKVSSSTAVKAYVSTLRATVKGPGVFRFSYWARSYADGNVISYSVNGVKKLNLTKMSYRSQSDTVELVLTGPSTTIEWTYDVSNPEKDYSTGWTVTVDNVKQPIYCAYVLFNVSWVPADPFPPVLPRDGETEAEAVARELKETFSDDSPVVKNITSQDELAAFNDFVKNCGIAKAEEIAAEAKPHAYDSFVLSSVMQTPTLLTDEPKLEIITADAPTTDWCLTVRLRAGDQLIPMVAERLRHMIRVGTAIGDITHEPTVVASPGTDGGELTFTVRKPGAATGFSVISIRRSN